MATDKISISRFSLITRLSQKALRLYDEKGLLIPEEKNHLTGYRYYSINQIELGLKIKSLSVFGFGLDEIAEFLDAFKIQDEKRIQSLINKRISEIRGAQKRLAHLESLLLSKRNEVYNMNLEEPTIKELPALRVISLRKIGSFDPTIGELIGRLCATVSLPENSKNITVTGPIMSLCYDEDYKETNNDIECALPISGQIILQDSDIAVKTLPACKVVSYIHKGPYSQLHEKYTFLFHYIEEHGMKVNGPCRELYFNDPNEVSEEDLSTEIQIPIQ